MVKRTSAKHRPTQPSPASDGCEAAEPRLDDKHAMPEHRVMEPLYRRRASMVESTPCRSTESWIRVDCSAAAPLDHA